MLPSPEAHPLYRPLACSFCLPSFVFLLAPLLKFAGETGDGLSLLAVLTSLWVAPMFTLGALALAMADRFTTATPGHHRRMWTIIGLAVAANLLLSAGGLAGHFLH